MGFFVDPRSPTRGLGMGIFILGQIKNLRGIGINFICYFHSRIGIFGFSKSLDFYPGNLGLLSQGFGNFISVIGDFKLVIRNFYLRDWRFLENLGIFIPRIGDWGFQKDLSPGFFIPGIFWGWEFFFVGWDILPKSHLCGLNYTTFKMIRSD